MRWSPALIPAARRATAGRPARPSPTCGSSVAGAASAGPACASAPGSSRSSSRCSATRSPTRCSSPGQERLDGLNHRGRAAAGPQREAAPAGGRARGARPHRRTTAKSKGLIPRPGDDLADPLRRSWLGGLRPPSSRTDPATGAAANELAGTGPGRFRTRRHRLSRAVSGLHPLRPPAPRGPAALGPHATRRRLGRACALTFLFMFAAVVMRLADVQVVHPGRYVSQGERQRFVSKQLPAGRGSMLDRNGVELALSLPQKSVFADPEMVGQAGKLTETARHRARAAAPHGRRGSRVEDDRHGPLRAPGPHGLRSRWPPSIEQAAPRRHRHLRRVQALPAER